MTADCGVGFKGSVPTGFSSQVQTVKRALTASSVLGIGFDSISSVRKVVAAMLVWPHTKLTRRWRKRGRSMSDFEYRRNPSFDSSKPRIAGILREHGLVSATAFVNLVYEDIKAGAGNFLDVQAILNAARRHKVPEDESLWEGVFENFPERDTPGNRLMLLSESPRPIT